MKKNGNAQVKDNGSKPGLLQVKGTNDTGTSFDWGAVDPARLSELIRLITGRGGAVRFGYSRDGNAGSIGIYYGDERNTLYIRPNEDYENCFRAIEQIYEQLPFSGGKSPQ